MEVLSDLIGFDFPFVDLTSGNEVEMFTEECSNSELIKWDACGRPLHKMADFGFKSGHFFFKS